VAAGAVGAASDFGAAQPGSAGAAQEGSVFAHPQEGSAAGAAQEGSDELQVEQDPLEQELQLEQLDSLEQELHPDEQPW
jgi:hypothetical protein